MKAEETSSHKDKNESYKAECKPYTEFVQHLIFLL